MGGVEVLHMQSQKCRCVPPSVVIVNFEREKLLAHRILNWMGLPGRPGTWESQWFAVGHFVSFLPGSEEEIESAIERLIDEERVVVHPVLRFIALPSPHTRRIAEGTGHE